MQLKAGIFVPAADREFICPGVVRMLLFSRAHRKERDILHWLWGIIIGFVVGVERPDRTDPAIDFVEVRTVVSGAFETRLVQAAGGRCGWS